MLRFLEPDKKLTPQDRHQIKLAHDDLASGKINQSDYVIRLHRVDPAITLPLRLDRMTCKEAEIGYCVCDRDSDCYDE